MGLAGASQPGQLSREAEHYSVLRSVTSVRKFSRAFHASSEAERPCLGNTYFALYSLVLYVSQTRSWSSCQTSAFLGRSIASVALFVIASVPAFGLPKIMTVLGRMSSPAFLAAAA